MQGRDGKGRRRRRQRRRVRGGGRDGKGRRRHPLGGWGDPKAADAETTYAAETARARWEGEPQGGEI